MYPQGAAVPVGDSKSDSNAASRWAYPARCG